jgi:hypothetical protein
MQNRNKEIHKNMIHMLAPLNLSNGVPLGISASFEECTLLSLCLLALKNASFSLVRPLNLALSACFLTC